MTNHSELHALDKALNYLNEASQDLLSKDEKQEIINAVNKYKAEINQFCKTTDDKDFVIQDIFRFKGISYAKVIYYSYNKLLVLDISSEEYDFPKAHKKVCLMLIEKLNKEFANKYKFSYNDKVKAIVIDYLEKDKLDSDSLNKAEYDRINKLINSNFNPHDSSKWVNCKDTKLINDIKRQIKSSTSLSKDDKNNLLRNLDTKVKVCTGYLHDKEIFDSGKATEEQIELRKLYTKLGGLLTKAGFPSSKKTWYIEGYDPLAYPDNYFIYVYFDSNYSGTSGDYDNGLSEKDKVKNSNFVRKLHEICRSMEKEDNVSIDIDEYRGFGSVTISLR